MFFNALRLRREVREQAVTIRMLTSQLTAKHLTNERLLRENAMLRAKLKVTPQRGAENDKPINLDEPEYPVAGPRY